MNERTTHDALKDVVTAYRLLDDFLARWKRLLDDVSADFSNGALKLRPIDRAPHARLDTHHDTGEWLPWCLFQGWSANKPRARKQGRWPDKFVGVFLWLADPNDYTSPPIGGVPELDLVVVHEYIPSDTRTGFRVQEDVYWGVDDDSWGGPAGEWLTLPVRKRCEGRCSFGYDLFRLPLDRIASRDDVKDQVSQPLGKRFTQVSASKATPLRKTASQTESTE